jgi:hypothetical protein
MAVDSKNGENGTSAASRRKRPSSLMSTASSLPSVESSLEEFIARANQTLVDASTWDQAEKVAKQEDDKRREADAQRWKAAEHQMRDSQTREQGLRHQLDGLQGKLAEAEARAAVATSIGPDGVVADLKVRLSQTDGALQEAQSRAYELEEKLIAAKSAAARATEQAAVVRQSAPAIDSSAMEDRVRLAEAKANKALAAAKAAAAGLTVSPADLAAIESGLVVAHAAQPSKARWVWVLVAFAAGIAIMFGIIQLVGNKDKDQGQGQGQTAAAPAAQPAAPTPQPAAAAAAPPPAPQPTVTPIDEPAPAPAAAAAAPAHAVAAPAPAKAASAPVRHVTSGPGPGRHTPAKAAPAKAAPAGIADPFGGSPTDSAPKATPPKSDDKKSGGLVDPF